MQQESGDFHSQDGLMFKRRHDGSVRVWVVEFPGDKTVFETILPATSWGSVMATMSAHGETGPTWRAAVAIHHGDVAWPDDV